MRALAARRAFFFSALPHPSTLGSHAPVFCSARAVSFPPAFGEPPRAMTRDLRPLPFGYGTGSGTLARWLTERAQAVYSETAEEYAAMN